MSTINSANVQVGQSGTANNNITLSTSVSGDLVINKGVFPALTEISRITNAGLTSADKVSYLPAGAGAVATDVQSKLRESVSVKDFGANPSASASANYTAFAAATTYAAANGLGLVIPAGTYSIGSNWVISTGGLRVHAEGKVVLSFTNTGKCVSIDGGAASSIYDVQFGSPDNQIHIKGNASTTDALYMRAAQHCIIGANVRDCITGFRQEFGVCNKLYITCSVNEGAFVLTPTSGMVLDQRNPGEQSAACEIYPLIEGVTGAGVVGTSMSFCTVFGGTSEGNGKGITFSASSRVNTVISTDFESNATSNIEDAGSGNSYFNVNAIQSSTIQMTGDGATFSGGSIRGIVLDAASTDTTFIGIGFSSAVGISGTGTYKRVGCYTVDSNGLRNGTLSDLVGDAGKTWTPALASAGGGAQGAVTFAVGNYSTIGKMCFVQGLISIAKGTLGAGALSITGLPFQSANVTNHIQYINLGQWDSVALGAGYTHLTLRISPNNAQGSIIKSGLSVVAAVVNVADFPDPINIRFSGVYETV